MTFKEGLINARSHLIFLLGLCVAFGLVIKLEMWDVEQGMRLEGGTVIVATQGIPNPPMSHLTPEEQTWARIAWQYFEVNYQPQTGLVNSADKYPATTLWDTSSYLMALISAHRLEIISQHTFDTRLSLALTSLAKLPLFDNHLPNKSYNTMSLEMVDYNNNLSHRGLGWSAIDVGRLLVPLNIIVWNYPQHAVAVKKILSRWAFDKLIVDGVMNGATVGMDGTTVYVQEGRLGYEQYAAKTLLLLGVDVTAALNYARFLKFMPIYGIQIPTDTRTPDKFTAHNYVVSEPYILDGLEFGWDKVSKEFAYRVYQAQEARYKDTGILTAVSEDNIDQAPHFVYNTVFTGKKFWQAITDKGEDASAYKTISTKAVFGWNALYKTPYTQKLMEKIKTLHDPQRGWFSGWYEVSQKPNKIFTANTNAIILQSLCYQQFGKLVNFRATN